MEEPQTSEGNPMTRYVGLDAHSKKCVYMIQDELGGSVGQGSVATTEDGLLLMKARHELQPGTRVALESGTVAFFVARVLTKLGFDVRVVDAHEVRAKALRPNQKCDRRDALELCEGLRRGLYRSVVHVPPQPIERLRETLGRRRHLVRVKTMQVNAIKRLLRTAGMSELSRSLQTEKGWNRLLEAVAQDAALHRFCSVHHAVWRCAHEQVVALEEWLREQQQPFQEQLDRLQTVPGVGPIVAVTVLAVFSDVHRFPSAKHAASYAGLVASTYDSGDRVQHGHITRRGSTELRGMLCEAAHHAGYRNNAFSAYFSQLCVRRGYKMAVVAVAHRLCRILYAMLRDGTAFDLNQLGVEKGHFEHTSVRYYRRKSKVVTTV
jgi:transposase